MLSSQLNILLLRLSLSCVYHLDKSCGSHFETLRPCYNYLARGDYREIDDNRLYYFCTVLYVKTFLGSSFYSHWIGFFFFNLFSHPDKNVFAQGHKTIGYHNVSKELQDCASSSRQTVCITSSHVLEHCCCQKFLDWLEMCLSQHTLR